MSEHKDKGCTTCDHCEIEYIVDGQKFFQCTCESSLMYMTNLSDVFNGTYPSWGCTEHIDGEPKEIRINNG